MKLHYVIALSLVAGMAYADLGISDTVSETSAKNQASSLGITQIYDHPADVANGQYVIPVQYNRTAAEGNGTEHDANNAKANDIDYVPLSQLKGAAGTKGVAGSQGTQGVQGVQGAKGDQGLKGDKGDPGDNGNNRLTLNIGASVRWYDWQRVNLTSGYRYDVRHYGHTVDMLMVNIKLGQSSEDREIAKLKALVEQLLRK